MKPRGKSISDSLNRLAATYKPVVKQFITFDSTNPQWNDNDSLIETPIEYEQVKEIQVEVEQDTKVLTSKEMVSDLREEAKKMMVVAESIDADNFEDSLENPQYVQSKYDKLLTDGMITKELYDIICLEPEIEEYLKLKEGKVKKARFKELVAKVTPYLPRFADTPELLDFQRLAIPRILRLTIIHKQSSLWIMPTGSGKTFITAYNVKCVRYFDPKRFPEKREIMVVTKPTLQIQTRRVVSLDYKNKRIGITSYPQITDAAMSKVYLEYTTRIVDDQPCTLPVWCPETKPALFIGDEIQCGKNDSNQSEMIRAYGDKYYEDEQDPVVWMMSATPYSKPTHIKTVTLLIKPRVHYTYGWRKIGRHNFNQWLRDECGACGCTPDEWSEKAMARLQKHLEPYTVRFDKIHFKKRTLIKQLVIDFKTDLQAQMYADAYKKFLEKCHKDNKKTPEGRGAALAAKQIFRKQAELIRGPDLAQFALDSEAQGYSVIIASSFVGTLELVDSLLKKAGLGNKIAYVKGGQTSSGRQQNVDDFQSDKKTIMLLMFSAGGAGLSLHQNNKENKRRRVVYLPPVWNAEELVQVLGRAHRVNSDSTTYQYIVWYSGTVEEDVAVKVKKKCSSLAVVVGRKEDWTAAFEGDEIGDNYATHDASGIEIDDDEEPLQGDFDVSTDESELDENGELRERTDEAAEIMVKE